MAEFSRRIRVDDIGSAPRTEALAATPAERAALARRFDLVALDRLEAELTLRREAAGIRVAGRVIAEAVQSCVISAEPVAAHIDEPVALLFVDDVAPARPDEEIELSAADCDVLPVDDGAVDLGEAVAQTLGLALDPYPRASDAVLAAARQRLTSEEEAAAMRNPFRKLKPE